MGFMQRAWPSVRLSVCLSVCRQNAKTRFSQKLSNLQLWCLLTTYRKSYLGFSKNPLLDPKIQDGADPPSWMLTPKYKNAIFWKLSNLELWCLLLLLTYRKLCNWAFQRTYYTGLLKSKMAEIRHLGFYGVWCLLVSGLWCLLTTYRK